MFVTFQVLSAQVIWWLKLGLAKTSHTFCVHAIIFILSQKQKVFLTNSLRSFWNSYFFIKWYFTAPWFSCISKDGKIISSTFSMTPSVICMYMHMHIQSKLTGFHSGFLLLHLWTLRGMVTFPSCHPPASSWPPGSCQKCRRSYISVGRR